MKLIEKLNNKEFPFNWVDLEFYPNSRGVKSEIYLLEETNVLEGSIFLFFDLFGHIKDEIEIFDNSWWDFCLDTWNPINENYDYNIKGKSNESKVYLEMLSQSDIEIGFSGSCRCLNWDKYLPIVLKCIISNQAPYSQIYYSKHNNFFFYFHSSGSIGFYYKIHNDIVEKILTTAVRDYRIGNVSD